MKYLFIFTCLLACVFNSICELEFDINDILHKKEPKAEPEPMPKMPKFKYSLHDDDDHHWGKKPKHLFIDHDSHEHHMPQHHEEEDFWWTTPEPKPKKKKSFMPKEVKDILGKDFLKKLIPDLKKK